MEDDIYLDHTSCGTPSSSCCAKVPVIEGDDSKQQFEYDEQSPRHLSLMYCKERRLDGVQRDRNLVSERRARRGQKNEEDARRNHDMIIKTMYEEIYQWLC